MARSTPQRAGRVHWRRIVLWGAYLLLAGNLISLAFRRRGR